MNMLSVNPARMRTTRRMLGMTRAGLSSATDGRVSVHAIARLERGQNIRDDGIAAASLAAALEVPYEFLLGQPEYRDYRETPSWRAVKKIPDYVSEGLYERFTYYIGKYRELEEYIEGREVPRRDLSPEILELRAGHNPGSPLTPGEVEQYANRLREHICVSQEQGFPCLEPITAVMEDFGIKVACWPLLPGVSGLSMTYGAATGNNAPPGAAVLVNRNHPVERRRFSLAHEWGHLVLPQTGRRQGDETACNRFAASLLMPAPALQNDVADILGGSIAKVSDAFRPEIVCLKTRYGVSIAALLRRCNDVGLIQPPNLYDRICRRLGQRGWFRIEPEPLWQYDEQPKIFTTLIQRLDHEDRQRSIDKEFLGDVRFLETA